MPAALKRTPLYDEHIALGARMVPFAGWEMPVQYAGIIEEHNAVRSSAGVFDVCHMAEFRVFGFGALAVHQGSVIGACAAVGRWTNANLDLQLKAPGFRLEPPKGHKGMTPSRWDKPLGERPKAGRVLPGPIGPGAVATPVVGSAQ